MTAGRMSFVALFAFVLTTVGPALGSVERVIVHVDGMACPFCAHNIEKRMKTLEGVDTKTAFTVSVERGLAELAWRQHVEFDPAAVRDQIRRAGFTPAAILITAVGAIEPDEADGERLQLVSDKTGRSFGLDSAERADRLESYSALGKYVRETADQNALFIARVTGEVIGEGPGWRLILHQWQPVVFGAEIVLSVGPLTCENCSVRVVRALGGLPDVVHAEADHEGDRVRLWTRSAQPDLDAVRRAIEQAGFKVNHVHVEPRKNVSD
jgi:copper chaperone CopZ